MDSATTSFAKLIRQQSLSNLMWRLFPVKRFTEPLYENLYSFIFFWYNIILILIYSDINFPLSNFVRYSFSNKYNLLLKFAISWTFWRTSQISFAEVQNIMIVFIWKSNDALGFFVHFYPVLFRSQLVSFNSLPSTHLF